MYVRDAQVQIIYLFFGCVGDEGGEGGMRVVIIMFHGGME